MYNPQVTPWAPNVTPQAGAIWADAIAGDGPNSIAGAILGNAHKREEKEKWQKTVTALQPMFDQMTGGKVKLDKDTPKEAIPALIQHAEAMEREQRERPMRELHQRNLELTARLTQSQIEAEQRRRDQDALNIRAGRDAVAPVMPDPTDVSAAWKSGPTSVSTPWNGGRPIPSATNPSGDEILRRFIGAGGADTGRGETALLLAAAKPQRVGPQVIPYTDPASKETFNIVWDGNNAKQLQPRPPAKLEKPLTSVVKVGSEEYTVGPGNRYFDRNGKPVKFGDSLAELLGGTDSARNGVGVGTEPATEATPEWTEEQKQALAWAEANPRDPRSAKIKQKLGIK